jgi:hypothetical protein
MFSKWECVFWEYAKDDGLDMTETEGLLSKNSHEGVLPFLAVDLEMNGGD